MNSEEAKLAMDIGLAVIATDMETNKVLFKEGGNYYSYTDSGIRWRVDAFIPHILTEGREFIVVNKQDYLPTGQVREFNYNDINKR